MNPIFGRPTNLYHFSKEHGKLFGGQVSMKNCIAIFATFFAMASAGFADSPFADPRQSTPTTIRMLTPEVMEFMQGAETVSVFHADLTKKTDDARYEVGLRPIYGEERVALVAIVANPSNYDQGLYCVVEPPADLGIEFRKKDEKLLLICSGGLVDGTFLGRRLTGLMEPAGNRLFTDWFREFPQPK
jgi:hypothetical protein